MISDDTEHACMTAQALLESRGKPGAFARSLAWRLRGWLLGMPAGVGWATLRSIVKLWVGFGPDRSGVRSAGNGPAMRAPILGVWIAATGIPSEFACELINTSTRITHTDDRAVDGAAMIALAASRVAAIEPGASPGGTLDEIMRHVKGNELRERLAKMETQLAHGASTREYLESIGIRAGVSGYINHSVPASLYCFLRWPHNFRRAVEDAIVAGGDTDTTAALVGGLAGAAGGVAAIPKEWLGGLLEWPRSVAWMQSLGARLARQVAEPQCRMGTQRLFWPGLALRNPIFVALVLAHGFRRLLPPY